MARSTNGRWCASEVVENETGDSDVGDSDGINGVKSDNILPAEKARQKYIVPAAALALLLARHCRS